MCWRWMCAPVYAARITFRATIMSSAAFGQPRSPSRVDMAPSFITAPCGHRRVLAVVHQRQVEHLRILAGAPHELVALDALAVVGDRHDPGALQRAGGRERLALQTDGDAAGRQHLDHGVAPDGVVDVLDRAGVVGDGRGVRHAHDGGEAAGGRGPGAGRDRLLVRLAGLPEMDMDIDEPGAGDEAVRRRSSPPAGARRRAATRRARRRGRTGRRPRRARRRDRSRGHGQSRGRAWRKGAGYFDSSEMQTCSGWPPAQR